MRVSPSRQSREFAPDDAAEACAWLDAALRPREATASPTDTLGDWAAHWHATYVVPIRSPGTARVALWALGKLSRYFGMPLHMIRKSQLQTVAGEIAPTLTSPILRAVVGTWARCLQAAVDDQVLVFNPARGILLPAAEKQAATTRRHITAAEVAVLWPAIRDHRFEAAYALVLGCGLRIGEILGLSWARVDLDAGTAWIQEQFTEGVWRPVPKGSNPHAITLPPAVVAALRRHRDGQPSGAVLVMQSAYGRLRKRDRDGKPWPWSRATVADDLAKLLAELGIERATPHSGRHGLASYWLDGGVPAAVVAERLGHANAAITMTFYARPSKSGHQLADELAAQLLGGTAQNGVSAPDPATLGSEVGSRAVPQHESEGDSV